MKRSKIYSILRILTMPFFKVIYRFKIEGQSNIPSSGRCILCANHTSMADPVLLAIALKRQICFMGKAELFKNKFLGKLLLSARAFPVNRGKKDSEAINYSLDILKQDEIMGIFIEGTRSKNDEFLRPKPGAALIAYNTDSPIIPVYIRSKGGKRIKAFRKSFVIIGKPISPHDLGITSVSGKELRDASRLIMEKIKELSPEII